MNINWKVRFRNKAWVISFVSAIIVLIQVVAAVFGYTLDLGDTLNKLKDVINAAFVLLALLGIVTDPTTAGVSDSTQALTYEKPKDDKEG